MERVDVLMRIAIVFFLTFASVSSSKARQDTSGTACKPCRDHTGIVGRPFVVHGALSLYNGAPSVRLWRIGTNRILGVSEGRSYVEGYCNLSKWLQDKLGWNTEVIGDFEVYPFTKDKPGVMQLICLDTAYNLKVIPWK